MVTAQFLSFGLIVVHLGPENALKVANKTTFEILIWVFVLGLFASGLNYLIVKTLVVNKKPLCTSLLLTGICIILFLPILFWGRQKFITYHNGSMQLKNYLDTSSISEAQIITHSDTILVDQLNNFLEDIGSAKYNRGLLKYGKTFKLKFKFVDGSIDSISTNGEIFGEYQGRVFIADSNVIVKYLNK